MKNVKNLLSKIISANSRVYYVDVRKDKNGERYVSLSEIPTNTTLNNKRHRVFIYGEKLNKLIEALKEAADFIEDESPE